MNPMPCHIPGALTVLPNWSLHDQRRPLVNIKTPEKGKVLSGYGDQALEGRKPIGLIMTNAHNYAVIDVDYPVAPGENKQEAVKKFLQDAGIDDKRLWGAYHFAALYKAINPVSDVKTLLQWSYSEFSFSGGGFHIVVELPNGYKDAVSRAYKGATSFAGQISMQRCFITFTNRPVPEKIKRAAAGAIMKIDADFMRRNFGLNPDGTVVQPGVSDSPMVNAGDDLEVVREDAVDKAMNAAAEAHEGAGGDADITNAMIVASDEHQAPALSTISRALAAIPINKNPRIRRLYKEMTAQEYTHYDFWISIGMALHHWGTCTGELSEAYRLFLSWSKKDKTSFVSSEDVETHWMSFSSKRSSSVTWRTIMHYRHKYNPEYPKPKLDKEGHNTGLPITSEYVNLEYLFNFFAIELHEDSGNFFLSGDLDIIQKYFQTHCSKLWFGKYYGPYTVQDLYNSTLFFCQENKWTGVKTVSGLVDIWISRPRKEFDLFSLWLDTDFEQLDDDQQKVFTKKGVFKANAFDSNSNIDYLFDTIKLAPGQDAELAKSMLYKTFMQLIKFREKLTLQFDDNGGMYILIGPENVSDALKDTSVVVASYDIGDDMRGLIGVVGPTRMDYATVAARLSGFAEGLTRLFGKQELPPKEDTKE